MLRPRPATVTLTYDPLIEEYLAMISLLLPETPLSKRSLAVMILAEDESLLEWLHATIDDRHLKTIGAMRDECRLKAGNAPAYLINKRRIEAAEEIASKVGKSRVAITNTLRLLKLPDSVKNALIERRISEGHARSLLALSNPEAQAAALRTVVSQELNVRQTEELVRKLLGEKPVRKPRPSQVPELAELEERLRTSLGTKVLLKAGRKGGMVTIHYYSNEELEALMERLLKP